jgi:integrase
MGKRGNNEGSITKRADGRWVARITLESGKRKNFYAKTRQEASRLLASALRDLDKGLLVVGDKQTVQQYLMTWLPIIKPTLRDSTWIRYEELVRLHIIPTLGPIVLSRLTPQHLNMLYAQKLAEKLSPTTVRYIHVTLHKALEDAMRAGLVQRNVSDLDTPPRKAKRQLEVFTADQARAFLGAIQGDRLEALYVMAITSALREGELLALRWQDVDLEAGFVQVRMSHRKVKGRFIVNAPKTSHGSRKVALTAIAVAAMQKHRARQIAERLVQGPLWQDNDLVFPNEFGERLEATVMYQHRFLPLLKKAGLPLIRFHDLRHTQATLLLLQGVHPKVVSEMLGHSTINITLDIYSHVLPTMQRDATAALDKLLGPRPDADA